MSRQRMKDGTLPPPPESRRTAEEIERDKSDDLEKKRSELAKEAEQEFQRRAQAFLADYNRLVLRHKIQLQGVPIAVAVGNGLWAWRCDFQAVPLPPQAGNGATKA